MPSPDALTRPGDVILVWMLRLLGVNGLLALGAVVMPTSWMASLHSWLGLGELPRAPIVEYLTRTASMLYALLGAIFLVLASDLDRYRPLLRRLGLLVIATSACILAIDLAAGMPWWWSAFEGPPGIALGVALHILSKPGSS
jgi:hypothetical protein